MDNHLSVSYTPAWFIDGSRTDSGIRRTYHQEIFMYIIFKYLCISPKMKKKAGNRCNGSFKMYICFERIYLSCAAGISFISPINCCGWWLSVCWKKEEEKDPSYDEEFFKTERNLYLTLGCKQSRVQQEFTLKPVLS